MRCRLTGHGRGPPAVQARSMFVYEYTYTPMWMVDGRACSACEKAVGEQPRGAPWKASKGPRCRHRPQEQEGIVNPLHPCASR
eukprot:scaffold124799_cov33-Tisochrysis_lutea.AAC.3